MLRKELHKIYKKYLTTEERIKWASLYGYSHPNSLSTYMLRDSNKEASDVIIKALIQTIGEDKFNEYSKNVAEVSQHVDKISQDKNSQNILETTKSLIDKIFNSNDRECLLRIKENIEMACNSQLLKIKVEDEMK